MSLCEEQRIANSVLFLKCHLRCDNQLPDPLLSEGGTATIFVNEALQKSLEGFLAKLRTLLQYCKEIDDDYSQYLTSIARNCFMII